MRERIRALKKEMEGQGMACTFTGGCCGNHAITIEVRKGRQVLLKQSFAVEVEAVECGEQFLCRTLSPECGGST